MKKIFKLNYLFLIFTILTVFSLSSCTFKNDYITMENGVDVTVSKNLQEYFIYKDDIPSLHFDYNGVRVMIEADGAAYYFVRNNQYELSDKFAEHLSQYTRDEITIVSQFEQTRDKKGKAKFDKDQLPLDEFDEYGQEQKYSKEFLIVATQKDGTRYSYQFRSFVSNNKRYFIYQYTNNMGISIEQPLMVVEDKDGNNKLLLLPLPFDTKYEISGTSLTKESLIDKDIYLRDSYYTFKYPESLSSYTDDEKREKVKEWYRSYCEVNETNGFIVKYAGATFEIEFDQLKEDKYLGFRIKFIK